MYSNIRKIIIGPNVTENAMNYSLDQQVWNGHTIEHIQKNDDGSHTIWVQKDDETLKWKEISSQTPVTVEYSLDFS